MASAERPAKFLATTEALRTAASERWRALESVGNFSTPESRCMAAVTDANGA